MNLGDGDDLTGHLLDLLQLGKEIPEAALGDNVVGRKNRHLEQRRGGCVLGGQLAANDNELLELQADM